eukprot:4736099-Amphidinium_carterae.1
MVRFGIHSFPCSWVGQASSNCSFRCSEGRNCPKSKATLRHFHCKRERLNRWGSSDQILRIVLGTRPNGLNQRQFLDTFKGKDYIRKGPDRYATFLGRGADFFLLLFGEIFNLWCDGPQISVDRQVVNSLRDAVRRYGLTPTQIDGIRDPITGKWA